MNKEVFDFTSALQLLILLSIQGCLMIFCTTSCIIVISHRDISIVLKHSVVVIG